MRDTNLPDLGWPASPADTQKLWIYRLASPVRMRGRPLTFTRGITSRRRMRTLSLLSFLTGSLPLLLLETMYTHLKIAPLLLLTGTSIAGQLRRYNFTITSQWSAGDGHGRPVFAINGQSPGPLIEAEEGDEIEVFLENQLASETTMHWYGQWEEFERYND